MKGVNGLHHITAIAGPAQENLDFYAGILGMRLVKKSVNQDDPGTYHLFYADAAGSPGTDLTFFPWPNLRQPRRGHGLTSEVGLEIPNGTLAWWADRLRSYGITIRDPETRFGAKALPLTDPHGLDLVLVESPADHPRAFQPWEGGPVEPTHQVRGLHGARVIERDPGPTVNFLTSTLGFERLASENGWTRFGFRNAPGVIDVIERTDLPRGAWGVGAVHHLAWRVDDEAHERAVRQRVEDSGGRPTEIIDRFWFRSVYFLEPGGVLFEIATDGPGFGIDEDAAHLGETLVLPPFLESHRAEIERALPELKAPSASRS
jgi:glyoxalase family protein